MLIKLMRDLMKIENVNIESTIEGYENSVFLGPKEFVDSFKIHINEESEEYMLSVQTNSIYTERSEHYSIYLERIIDVFNVVKKYYPDAIVKDKETLTFIIPFQ